MAEDLVNECPFDITRENDSEDIGVALGDNVTEIQGGRVSQGRRIQLIR